MHLSALDVLAAAPLGFQLHWFGALVALGLVTGKVLVGRASKVYGPGDSEHALAAYTACVIGGIVGAHLLEVFVYQPELLRTKGPGILLRVWEGSASMGGALGGLGSILLYFRSQKLAAGPYLDALALGIVPGWGVARLGCAASHDHPGIRSWSWLAVGFPDGPRLDLGLLDALVLLALGAVLWLLARKRRPEGALFGMFALGYSVPRFLLDFLRATDLPHSDRRLLGLTPAQWICPLLAAGGLWLLRNGLRGTPLQPPEHPEAALPAEGAPPALPPS